MNLSQFLPSEFSHSIIPHASSFLSLTLTLSLPSWPQTLESFSISSSFNVHFWSQIYKESCVVTFLAYVLTAKSSQKYWAWSPNGLLLLQFFPLTHLLPILYASSLKTQLSSCSISQEKSAFSLTCVVKQMLYLIFQCRWGVTSKSTSGLFH